MRVGIITASTGAAVKDILSTIKRRYTMCKTILFPSLVQGEYAAPDIVRNIKRASNYPIDLLIVGLGGGSIEDLWNFNEEDVVKAIYACETPIISAVGHETDFTLSDFVADVRAATPTQAAVMATPDQYELRQYLQQLKLSLTRFINQHIQQQRKHLEHVASYYKFKTPTLLYDQQIQKRDDLEKQLNLNINFKINQHNQQLQLMKQNFNLKYFKQSIQREQTTISQKQMELNKLMNHYITKQKNNLTAKLESLNNLSPTNTMLRGYTIVNKEDKVITSTNDLVENDNIVLTMKDGIVDAQVKKVRCNDDQ